MADRVGVSMAKRTCSIDGCDRAHCARGFCKMHWSRWRTHGDPLRVDPKPQNLPRHFGCSSEGCEGKHFARGFCHIHYQRDYHARNSDVLKAQQAEHRAAHREEARAVSAAWRAANPERSLELGRRYHRENPDKVREQKRRYREANRDAIRTLNNRRKALHRGAEVNDLTGAQWTEIKAAYGHRCAYCGCKPKRLTQDHVIPLAKGGHHTASNVVPACQPCNSRKGDRAAPAYQPLLM